MLRICSWNLRCDFEGDGPNRWSMRKAAVAERLAEIDADIYAFQEPRAHQVDDLLRMLPDWMLIGVGRDDGQRGGEFSPLMVRRTIPVTATGTWWISETPDVPGSIGYGAHLPRLVTWAECGGPRPFRCYGTHLDHESQDARRVGLLQIADHLPTTMPWLVAGDFNLDAAHKAFAPLRARGTDTLAGRQEGTWNAFVPGATPTERIDSIWVSPEWRVERSWIDSRPGAATFPSDHFPVVADLGWMS